MIVNIYIYIHRLNYVYLYTHIRVRIDIPTSIIDVLYVIRLCIIYMYRVQYILIGNVLEEGMEHEMMEKGAM